MKKLHLHIVVGFLAALIVEIIACERTSAADSPKRLKRADSFLGIHFDFHAGDDCKEIGKNTTRGDDREHHRPGPARLPADRLQGPSRAVELSDQGRQPGAGLRRRSAAALAAGDRRARRGALHALLGRVGLARPSGSIPDWAAVNADGKRNGNATSFFGPYADKLLIPQLRELAGDYGVDGVWVDGECWASVPDYGEAALKAFREATGIQDVPRKPGDPHWFEFLAVPPRGVPQLPAPLHRRGEEDASRLPDLQQLGLHRPHARAGLRAGGFPLGRLFAGGQRELRPALGAVPGAAGQAVGPDGLELQPRQADKTATNQKTAVQLQREAAVVLALGGGFQAYFKQKRDGSIFDEQMPVMAEVAKFCRARQALCHHAEAGAAGGAALFDRRRTTAGSTGCSTATSARISGTLQALLESQQSVEVLGEHHLAGRMAEYPLIVVPEWDYLEPEFIEELVAYVKAGGNLLLVGPKTAALFAAHVDLLADRNAPARTVSSVVPLGKGRIAAVHSNFGQEYLRTRDPKGRQFLGDLVRQLFPKPLVEVTGSHDVDVAVNRIGGKLAVNLVNTAGPHADKTQPIIESIPPVGPLQIAIRAEKKPARVTLEPGAQPLPFEHADGQVRLTLPKLEIHSIIVVE